MPAVGGASGNRGGSPSLLGAAGSEGRSLGSVHEAYRVSLRAGRPAGPHYPPRSPPQAGEAETRLRSGLTRLTPEGSPSRRIQECGLRSGDSCSMRRSHGALRGRGMCEL